MKRLCLLIAVSLAPAAGAAYKCVDENGLTHIGDTPPAGCANVVMYEVSKSGAVMRKIDPTPTPEQVKARDAEFERARESLKSQSEQKRKDMALLNTFSAEREFDVVRDRNIEPIRARIRSAEERIKAVEKRQLELEEEMEFYRAGKSKARTLAPPPQLSTDLTRVRNERTALMSGIARDEKEIEKVKEKFDADKKRWLALKSATPSKPAPPEKAASPEPRAATSDPKAVRKN